MDWSLEKIYRQQIRGNVPQRRHLRVLGEATEEKADYSEADILKTKEEIKQAIDLNKYITFQLIKMLKKH